MVKGLLRRAPQAAGGGLGAVSASQFPAFYGQYLQSLGGRLDQAREQAARLDAMAAEIGLSASAYAQRLSASADEAIQRAPRSGSGPTAWRSGARDRSQARRSSAFSRRSPSRRKALPMRQWVCY